MRAHDVHCVLVWKGAASRRGIPFLKESGRITSKRPIEWREFDVQHCVSIQMMRFGWFFDIRFYVFNVIIYETLLRVGPPSEMANHLRLRFVII